MIEQDVVDAIKSRVSNRAYVNVFAQAEAEPVYPAARVFLVSGTPDVDLCGDGGEETADFRIQIDIAVNEGAGYSALKTIQTLVMADMAAFDPPAVCDSFRSEFDEETRTHRCSLDYLIYPSSPPESP